MLKTFAGIKTLKTNLTNLILKETNEIAKTKAKNIIIKADPIITYNKSSNITEQSYEIKIIISDWGKRYFGTYQ